MQEEANTSKPEHHVARKSTSGSSSQGGYATRQAAARANKNLRSTNSQGQKFLENFNPETSVREKRKLIRKINAPSNVKRPSGALYDENGIHLATGIDLCDCLNKDCEGCFFPCPKCGNQKCGTDCRVHRKFLVEFVEYHGYDNVIKNPLMK